MPQKLSMTEYVILIAFVTSIGAMGSDIMLPALDDMGRDLNVANPNDVHFAITSFFLGMAIGQVVVGPLSDSYGRKPVIFWGYAVFIAGCALSYWAESWGMMLAGRILQGLGAAAPRVAATALVRDEHEGRAMAQIMSVVMAVFIFVPIIAPTLGLGLITLGGWSMTYVGLATFAAIAALWFQLRQRETLAPENRRPFRIAPLLQGAMDVLRSRVAVGYTLASGLITGAFFGYLGSAQQVFEQTFQTGDLFVAYFALASASIGASALLNARLVMRLGMRKLTWLATLALALMSCAFFGVLILFNGIPPFAYFIIWQLACFFCVGIIFGNIMAMAMEPLGHIAGLAAAFVGALGTFIALPLAAVVGKLYDGTIYPLIGGFALMGVATLLTMWWTERS